MMQTMLYGAELGAGFCVGWWVVAHVLDACLAMLSGDRHRRQ